MNLRMRRVIVCIDVCVLREELIHFIFFVINAVTLEETDPYLHFPLCFKLLQLFLIRHACYFTEQHF